MPSIEMAEAVQEINFKAIQNNMQARFGGRVV
jgi:hypothetical protein